MKKWSYLFTALAVVLSDIMCFVVAYNYRGMLCGIEHRGFSAPASIAFLSAIPFLIGIIMCVVLAIRFHRKSNFKFYAIGTSFRKGRKETHYCFCSDSSGSVTDTGQKGL